MPSLTRMRLAIFDNLANSAYIQAKALRELGHPVDLVLDPFDRFVMSDPRWEELDLEFPPDELHTAVMPEWTPPPWIRSAPPFAQRSTLGGRLRHALANVPRATTLGGRLAEASRAAGWRGSWMAAERAWIVRTLAEYDCVIAYGAGPAWAALAGVPCVAETWGGDMTMLPFYDTGDWEGHETLPLPGPRGELFAFARLQRLGYERAGRILLTDPRFIPFAERLGHLEKCVEFGFLIDTKKYSARPEPELRARLLAGSEGPLVFVPARQDFYWKGSDQLLRGFAAAARSHPGAVLACAGWGADIERSRTLIDELGIGAQVRLLPHAMSKERLRRHYCAADVVADQFTVGSYGGSALEAMSCERPVLISLDPERFEARSASFPPVLNVSGPEEIATALAHLFDEPATRVALGARARAWVDEHHGRPLAERVLQLCETVMEEQGTPHTKLGR
ncbi:MAG TPA: glycosyltransferase family 4 protein [Solirubrobacteraceae bacterium]|jgi:glycosyltransferase involved in cell wall biosynthesis